LLPRLGNDTIVIIGDCIGQPKSVWFPNMGRQGRIGERFREHLKTERERRDWSQSDMAKMLSDKGIQGVYPTTIAKLEAGDRAVRIDELTAIADLFEVSTDALLGRKVGLENDLAYTLRGVLETARQSAAQIAAIRDTLHDRFRDLLTMEFDGLYDLGDDAAQALQALTDSSAALGRAAAFRLKPDAALQLRTERSFGEAFDLITDRFLREGSIYEEGAP